MTAETREYHKIVGRSLSWAGRARLWLGADHLLEVVSSTVVERYRRYFFHDTLAFVVQRTKMQVAWLWVQAVIGGGALLLAVGSALAGAEWAAEDWHILLYILAGISGVGAVLFFTLLGLNVLLGPSCRCHVLTSTGWHALAAPTRLKPAVRLQEQVVALVEAAQGKSPPPGSEFS